MKRRKCTEIICDICGKKIIEGSELSIWRYIIRKRKCRTLTEVIRVPWDNDLGVQYDLCPECEKRLEEFIRKNIEEKR